VVGFLVFETLPPARHAGDSSDNEDNGQNGKDDDIEHDSVHHILERPDTQERTARGNLHPEMDPPVRMAAMAKLTNIPPFFR
jgi:hypothetical protein